MHYDDLACTHCTDHNWTFSVTAAMLNSVQDKETALMMASRKGSVGIVKMLIHHGANVNLTNKVNGLCAWCGRLSFT